MKKGFTIVELIVAMAIIFVLLAVVLVNVNPIKNQNSAKDVKRISDLNLLEVAINAYRVDNKNYPDTVNVLRISTQLPSGNTQIENVSSGWIDQDMTGYLSRLPTDPVNDSIYHYSYIHSQTGYEINAKLESLPEQMQNDGGNDPNVYEVGNILTLISP